MLSKSSGLSDPTSSDSHTYRTFSLFICKTMRIILGIFTWLCAANQAPIKRTDGLTFFRWSKQSQVISMDFLYGENGHNCQLLSTSGGDEFDQIWFIRNLRKEIFLAFRECKTIVNVKLNSTQASTVKRFYGQPPATLYQPKPPRCSISYKLLLIVDTWSRGIVMSCEYEWETSDKSALTGV